MKINYCRIVEDLMPLYYDNLISEESKDFVEWHIKGCNECMAKYRNMDQTIPVCKTNEIPPKEEDNFKSAKSFLLKVRKRVYLSIFLAVIIIFTASTGSFLYGKNASAEGPIKVSSSEDFAQKVVPGWQRAQKSGQIKDLGISKPIPGTAATVTLEKVWYTSRYTYVLYTVNEPNKKYLMASQKDIDVPPDTNMKSNMSMEPLSQRFGGISPKGYHQVMVFLGYNTPVPAKELALTMTNWITPGKAPKLNSRALDGKVSVTLPLSDEYLAEKEEKIDLDKSFECKGRTLHITGLEVKFSKTLLYGEVKLQPGETLSSINGAIKCGNQSAYLNYESIVQGDMPDSYKFVFYADPLNEWPEKVSLDIDGIGFKTHDTLTVPIDWSLYTDKNDKVYVPSSESTTVPFYDVALRLATVIPNKEVNFEIVEASIKPYITISNMMPFCLSDNDASSLKITNENGAILNVKNSTGGNLEGDNKNYIGFTLDPNDSMWKNSKKIDVTISNPVAKLIVKQSIDLN